MTEVGSSSTGIGTALDSEAMIDSDAFVDINPRSIYILDFLAVRGPEKITRAFPNSTSLSIFEHLNLVNILNHNGFQSMIRSHVSSKLQRIS